MESRWKKVKQALGLRLCMVQPLTDDEERSKSPISHSAPSTPQFPSPLRLIRSGTRTSRRMCAICLDPMKPGHGHALFTAECSHTFHFHCIASNVKHGNKVCPVCRAKWTEVPLQGPPVEPLRCRTRINPVDWSSQEGWSTVFNRLPPPRPPLAEAVRPVTEPSVFNDDETLGVQSDPGDASVEKSHDSSSDRLTTGAESSQNTVSRSKMKPIERSEENSLQLKVVPEFEAIPSSEFHEGYTVLVHLQAPSSASKTLRVCQGKKNLNGSKPSGGSDQSRDRAPIDLVTVLDVSGSMAGTKLALLKRAMSFVIHNLGPTDRLSVIAFSSTARRLFPLIRMSEGGRQVALQSVNSLTSTGGTNIAEGLKKGAKVLEERREQNPVCSIILLSDGQDTYSVGNHRQTTGLPSSNSRRNFDYQCLLPGSIRQHVETGSARVPIHTFGFGADHDSASMHSISETSGGTFSFIETESIIQDAFAQCIGGLLSVVIQDMQVNIDCTSSEVKLNSIQAGSYSSTISHDHKSGHVKIGDLYAEEERDFLVHVKLPSLALPGKMDLIKVACSYKDPVSQETIRNQEAKLSIQRPETVGSERRVGSLEVDRQRNRLCTAESIAEARVLADRGDLTGAQLVLGNRRAALQASLAAGLGDRLCSSLDAELKQIQDRMASRQLYESSGRAYALSGLSSHSWQRVTTRGDTSESLSMVYGYQTPTMVDMLMRSQTLCPVPPDARSRSLLLQRSMPLPETRPPN